MRKDRVLEKCVACSSRFSQPLRTPTTSRTDWTLGYCLSGARIFDPEPFRVACRGFAGLPRPLGGYEALASLQRTGSPLACGHEPHNLSRVHRRGIETVVQSPHYAHF